MAITAAALTSGSNEADLDEYTTASITPTVDRLVLAAILSQTGSGTPNTPTVTGNGLTWAAVTTVTTTQLRLSVFRALGVVAPSAGVVTINFAAQAQNRCGWSITEFAGVPTKGSGAAAAVQGASNTGTSVTSLTVTLAAFGSAAENAVFGAFHVGANEDQTVGDGFTEIHDIQVGTSLGRLFTEWKLGEDVSVDQSSASAANRRGVAVEIGAAIGMMAPTWRPRRYV